MFISIKLMSSDGTKSRDITIHPEHPQLKITHQGTWNNLWRQIHLLCSWDLWHGSPGHFRCLQQPNSEFHNLFLTNQSGIPLNTTKVKGRGSFHQKEMKKEKSWAVK